MVETRPECHEQLADGGKARPDRAAVVSRTLQAAWDVGVMTCLGVRAVPKMLHNLAIGTVVISLTVLVHTFGLIAITYGMSHLVARFRLHGRRSRVLAMISVVMGLFAVLSVEVWLWAACYRLLGLLPDFDTALYFSTVTFSTIGYGDIVPGHPVAAPRGARRRQRISADRLVHRLSDRRGHTGRTV